MALSPVPAIQGLTSAGIDVMKGNIGFSGITLTGLATSVLTITVATNAWALLADGTYLFQAAPTAPIPNPATGQATVALASTTVTGLTTTGTYFLWLDHTTDSLNAPVWTATVIATAAPSVNAIKVGRFTVAGSVITHVAAYPAGVNTGGLKQAQVSVARTDTTAKDAFCLPANSVVRFATIYTAVASDAGTTATVSLGTVGGTNTSILGATSVLVGNLGLIVPPLTVAATIGASDVTVSAVYLETGTASSTGGSFVITLYYV